MQIQIIQIDEDDLQGFNPFRIEEYLSFRTIRVIRNA
jgi:hypothetical protein